LHGTSLPDLEYDSDDSSDDLLPPSLTTDVLPSFSEKQKQIATTGFRPGSLTSSSMTAAEQQDGYDTDFSLQHCVALGLISAISVY
jgi:hypothetical protein